MPYSVCVSAPVSPVPFRTSALPLRGGLTLRPWKRSRPWSSGSRVCDLGRSADCNLSGSRCTGKQDSLSHSGSGTEETPMPSYRASNIIMTLATMRFRKDSLFPRAFAVARWQTSPSIIWLYAFKIILSNAPRMSVLLCEPTGLHSFPLIIRNSMDKAFPRTSRRGRRQSLRLVNLWWPPGLFWFLSWAHTLFLLPLHSRGYNRKAWVWV